MNFLRSLDHALFLPLLVFGIEALAVGWGKSSIRRMFFSHDGSQRADILCFFVYSLGFNLAIMIGSFGAGYFLGRAADHLIGTLVGWHIHFDFGNAWINFGLYYLIYSFMYYWSHRLFHLGPLWNLHRFHHSATSMNPLVQHRNHPGQHAIEQAVFAFPLGLISVPVEAIIVLGLLNQFYQLIVHADVDWDWGWFGRWVLISPAAHRIHHSANPEHYGKNLSMLTMWDQIFGTFYTGNAPVTALGVESDRYNQYGAIADVLRDYWKFSVDIFDRLKRVKAPIFPV